MLAGTNRSQPGYTLSPASLRSLPMGSSLVLPSPNGATLALATGSTPTFAGCLRNARAVAEAASRHGRRVAVVASGERWADGSLRPAFCRTRYRQRHWPPARFIARPRRLA
jgi:2-phosphosulfolactate phosphatase